MTERVGSGKYFLEFVLENRDITVPVDDPDVEFIEERTEIDIRKF